jgi:hypothetical protein
MSFINTLNKRQIIRHITIWIIIIIYLNLYSYIPGSIKGKIIGNALEDFNYIIVFYSLSLIIFPKYWVENRRLRLFIAIICNYFIFSSITYLNYFFIIPYLKGKVLYNDHSITFLLVDNIYYYIIIGSAGIAFFFYHYNFRKYKEQSEIERSLLIKELNFLKNEFNSHITFNFLNYCYSKIHVQIPQTAKSIELFSEILRYNLQTKSDKKIEISNEIVNIENFINLQIILGSKVLITFNKQGKLIEKYIIPNILFLWIEYIFKFSIDNSRHYPIYIFLKCKKNKLFLVINNFKKNVYKLEEAQINLDKIIHTLSFHYFNNFMFKIKIDNGFIRYELILNI